MGHAFRSYVRNRCVDRPRHPRSRPALLIDGVGGSATMAVDVLKSRGVPEDRILFLNLIASPEGVTNFAKRFPKLRVVTAFVDQGLDEKKYNRPLPIFHD